MRLFGLRQQFVEGKRGNSAAEQPDNNHNKQLTARRAALSAAGELLGNGARRVGFGGWFLS